MCIQNATLHIQIPADQLTCLLSVLFSSTHEKCRAQCMKISTFSTCFPGSKESMKKLDLLPHSSSLFGILTGLRPTMHTKRVQARG